MNGDNMNDIAAPSSDDMKYRWQRADEFQLKGVQRVILRAIALCAVLLFLFFAVGFFLYYQFFIVDHVSGRYGGSLNLPDYWLNFREELMPWAGIALLIIFAVIAAAFVIFMTSKPRKALKKLKNGELMCAYTDSTCSCFYVRIADKHGSIHYDKYDIPVRYRDKAREKN